MKIPNLRAKFKPKGCKGNIHFGKIVLTFMLVGMMILGNVEPVKASEPLYYYDKYLVENIYEKQIIKLEPEYWYFSHYDPGREVLNKLKSTFKEFFRTRTISESTISHSREVYPEWVTVGGYISPTPDYAVKSNGDSWQVYEFESSGGSDNRSYWVVLSNGVRSSNVIVDRKRGSLISTITGTANQYPTNGIHTDGYWYVRKGLVNNNPTLSISTPSENSYFV